MELRDLLCPANRKLAPSAHAGRYQVRRLRQGTCGSWCADAPARRASTELSPHSLRDSAVTFALDAGATWLDVQDYAGHKDARTTRRYARDSLGRNAAYAVAAYLA